MSTVQNSAPIEIFYRTELWLERPAGDLDEAVRGTQDALPLPVPEPARSGNRETWRGQRMIAGPSASGTRSTGTAR
jgi:hypothetical protein